MNTCDCPMRCLGYGFGEPGSGGSGGGDREFAFDRTSHPRGGGAPLPGAEDTGGGGAECKSESSAAELTCLGFPFVAGDADDQAARDRMLGAQGSGGGGGAAECLHVAGRPVKRENETCAPADAFFQIKKRRRDNGSPYKQDDSVHKTSFSSDGIARGVIQAKPEDSKAVIKDTCTLQTGILSDSSLNADIPSLYGSKAFVQSKTGENFVQPISYLNVPYSGPFSTSGSSLQSPYAVYNCTNYPSAGFGSPAGLPGQAYGQQTLDCSGFCYASQLSASNSFNCCPSQNHNAYSNINGAPFNMSVSPTSTSSPTYQLVHSSLSDNGSVYSYADGSPVSSLKSEVSSIRASSRSSRGRGKKHSSSVSPDTESKLERVYIWELEDTILLHQYMMCEEFSKKHNIDKHLNPAVRMEELVKYFAEEHFFLNDISEYDQVHVDDAASDDNGQDLSNYNFAEDGFRLVLANHKDFISLPQGNRGGVDWMRKLAFRYRQIKEMYNKCRAVSGGMFDLDYEEKSRLKREGESLMKREEWLQVRQDIEILTGSWLTITSSCLNIVNSRHECKSTNVLVTKHRLIPTLTKILLYDLSSAFSVDNVYSAYKVGRENCFERIVTRFGKNCTYIVVGSTEEEKSAAQKMNFPFWRIECHLNIKKLHEMLELGYM